MSLANRILLAMVLGIAFGSILNVVVGNLDLVASTDFSKTD